MLVLVVENVQNMAASFPVCVYFCMLLWIPFDNRC
jgi:hypothetical protein